MVLHLKVRKSRSPPGPPISPTLPPHPFYAGHEQAPGPTIAGWSSPVARQAHNLKVVGSNPTPATIIKPLILCRDRGLFAIRIVLSRHRGGSDVEALGSRLVDKIDARTCGYTPQQYPGA